MYKMVAHCEFNETNAHNCFCKEFDIDDLMKKNKRGGYLKTTTTTIEKKKKGRKETIDYTRVMNFKANEKKKNTFKEEPATTFVSREKCIRLENLFFSFFFHLVDCVVKTSEE